MEMPCLGAGLGAGSGVVSSPVQPVACRTSSVTTQCGETYDAISLIFRDTCHLEGRGSGESLRKASTIRSLELALLWSRRTSAPSWASSKPALEFHDLGSSSS